MYVGTLDMTLNRITGRIFMNIENFWKILEGILE
jgi:hypothetical protein